MPTPNLAVGHDALYVWPAYVLSALVLVALVLDSLLRARRWRRAAERPKDDDL
jgi:heme exporter protein CcmD